MNNSELRALLDRAREYEHVVGAVTFRMRIPSTKQVARIYGRADGDYAEAMSEVLSQSLLSIVGATTADLALPGEPQPLPDTPESAREYLSDHMPAATELAAELMRRYQERVSKIEGDSKN